ncbi:hypothetical protein FSP39_009916 [Pinctada imbricata]|uniref:Phosphodiesterase n=1 Tax=Pinctada imbricata TaxID=66713 RepID=A0AA89C110_PINIB|nr:hypothetical protein FSP39_009916 [Pinctada imbricata]
MHCYLQEQQLVGAIPSLEVMTSLLAAMTHDLDHPGVNQAFLIATSNHLASLYQNTSVLENHHWRTAVGVFHETGVFKHLPQEKWQEIEWQIKSLILATDITRQQEFLSRFKKYLDSDSFNFRKNPEHRHFMLQIALKCADISNPCREWELSKQWSERVCDEFFRQGDLERNIHIPVTPMCNRQTTTVAKIQAGFMQFVVHPLFSEWSRFLPSKLSTEMLDNIDKNKKKWQCVIQEEQEKQLLQEKKEEEEVNSSNEEDKIESDIEDEMSDTVEEARLPLTFTHLVDNDDENSLAPGSRRGSCRSLSPLREISENGWCPEQRRHSMPPACFRREVTCVTIKRDSLPMNQYHRRRSLPTAVIVHTTSLDKLSGRLSGLATSKNSSGGKSISMEELLARPKISNLTMSYEASRLASGLSDVTQYRSQGGSVRFKNLPQVSQIPVSVTEPRKLDKVTSEKENIPLNPNSGHVINKEPFQTLPSDVAFAQNSEKSNVSTSFNPHSHEALNCVDKHNVQTPKPPVVVVGETTLTEPERTDICSNSLDRVNLIGNPPEDSSLLNLGISRSMNSTIKPASLSQ